MALIERQKFAWYARRAARRLGWTGRIGLVLLVFAVAYQLFAVSGVKREVAEAKAEAQSAYAKHQLVMKQPQAERGGQGRELESFYEFFPSVGTLPEWLARIYGAAQRQGLPLEIGEYKLVHESGKRLGRYQMTLPIKGSYEQIRGFVGQVLDEVPAAGLDDVVLRRESIGSRQLEARIRLTLFVRMGAS